MLSDEITSIVKGIVVPSTFPTERGGEKAYSARRGIRSVVWYVFLETGNPPSHQLATLVTSDSDS